MAKKATQANPSADQTAKTPVQGRPSVLMDTRVFCCEDSLEQLAKLPDAWLLHWKR